MSLTICYLPTNTASNAAIRYMVATTYAELPTIAPAVEGDLGYALDRKCLMVFNGTKWGTFINVVSGSDPASPPAGETWLRSDL